MTEQEAKNFIAILESNCIGNMAMFAEHASKKLNCDATDALFTVARMASKEEISSLVSVMVLSWMHRNPDKRNSFYDVLLKRAEAACKANQETTASE